MATGNRQRKPDAQVTSTNVAPLTGATAAMPVQDKHPKPFLSEGMRHDLESVGHAVDPVSGARYEVNRETGAVTVTEKDRTDPVTGEATKGKVTTIALKVDLPASTVDPDTGEALTTDPETGVVTATNPDTGETRTVE